MPYCKNCGAKLPEDALFCQNCGAPVQASPEPRFELASWGERFVAWLIDMIVLGVFLAPIRFFSLLAWWPVFDWAPHSLRWIPFVDFGTDSILYFVYWTFMEGIYGQSIGKMALKLKTKRLNGEPADIERAAIESLGKAFLLPLDCIIGWILYPDKKQRLFNYISDTVVVKVSR